MAADRARAAPRDEVQLLSEVRRGGATGFRRVVLTQNRRTMASVGEGGATLRLHESFAAAPDAVLHAVGRLFSARTEAGRRAARTVVREFLAARAAEAAERGEAPAPPRRQPRTAEPGDEPHLAGLAAEFERVNTEHFGGTLPTVPLHLSGRMQSRNGHFSRHPLEIVLNRRLCTHAHPGEAEMTLRHEMIHLWQHVVGAKPDHGGAFRWWARMLEVHPRARRPVNWK
jgi:hypothetical protein